MTFGNRFVAERCGNMAARVARTTGPPGAPSPLHRCEPDHGPTGGRVLIKGPPSTAKEVFENRGYDGGHGPQQPEAHFFETARR